MPIIVCSRARAVRVVMARAEHQRRGAPAHVPAFLLAARGKLHEIAGERFVDAGRLRREQGRQRIVRRLDERRVDRTLRTAPARAV